VATFAVIHGAGDVGRYWHLVETELRQQGHAVVAPHLPCDDDSAGLDQYVDTVADAIGDHHDVVVVGQSYGGFTAALVADRVARRRLSGSSSADRSAPESRGAAAMWDRARMASDQMRAPGGARCKTAVPRSLARLCDREHPARREWVRCVWAREEPVVPDRDDSVARKRL
jgi:pimeloyl-ACP methyl ester carboxylesterase